MPHQRSNSEAESQKSLLRFLDGPEFRSALSDGKFCRLTVSQWKSIVPHVALWQVRASPGTMSAWTSWTLDRLHEFGKELISNAWPASQFPYRSIQEPLDPLCVEIGFLKQVSSNKKGAEERANRARTHKPVPFRPVWCKVNKNAARISLSDGKERVRQDDVALPWGFRLSETLITAIENYDDLNRKHIARHNAEIMIFAARWELLLAKLTPEQKAEVETWQDWQKPIPVHLLRGLLWTPENYEDLTTEILDCSVFSLARLLREDRSPHPKQSELSSRGLLAP